jgi:DNA invertase Pin-like site-specific DNA recombinase
VIKAVAFDVEHQRAGMEAAKKKGVYRGRKL